MNSAQQLERLEQAALDAVQIPLRMAQAGRSMAELALCGAARFEPWRHYPAGDARDRDHGTQFYFHAHEFPRSADEHGHFHLFLRDVDSGGFHHLIALAIDPVGRPLRWFSTNEWVTGETLVGAATLGPALHDFSLRQRGRLAPLARWLQGLVRLYADEIEQVLRERDARLQHEATILPLPSVLQDRQLDVLSQFEIDLPQRIQALYLEPPTVEGICHEAGFEIVVAGPVGTAVGRVESGRLAAARPRGRQRLAGRPSGRGANL